MPSVKEEKSSKKQFRTLAGILPWILLVGGIIGVLASVALSTEVFDRLKNPHYVPICNLNPVLSCTSVADSHQAEAFGFPNYYIGIAGFASMATIGLAIIAGARFKRWFWLLFETGVLFGVCFITWLQFQSIYRIGALCIFCMIVWSVTIPVFLYTTFYVLDQKYLTTPDKLKRLLAFIRRHHGDVLVLWYLIIILLILKRFWYYWSTLL